MISTHYKSKKFHQTILISNYSILGVALFLKINCLMSKQKENNCAVTKDWFIMYLFTTENSNRMCERTILQWETKKKQKREGEDVIIMIQINNEN